MAVFYTTNLGIHLYSITQIPGTIAAGATITNVTANYSGDAVYGDATYAWTVYNFGTAEGTQVGSSGVRLGSGGDVHNASTGRIVGDAYGVAILASAGTVTNYGTIAATGATYSNAGVYLADGSIVTNGASGYITGYDGVRIAGIGTVTNYGTISGVGGSAVGISLYGGGVVTNQSSGLIAGEYGISVGIGAGTIINFGTIFGDEEAVSLVGAAGTVDNYGTLIGQYGYGAYLQAGGIVTNELGGSITGAVAGVKIDGAAGSVVNFATIDSATGGGIYLQAGGNVTNLSTGRIEAYVDGIFINGGSGTVVNFGTIETTLAGGGGIGVDLNSGLVINEATGAILAASGLAVEIGPSGTLVNYGTIANNNYYGDAVKLQAGGTLISGAGGAGTALIVGYDGVRIYGPSASLTNYGTIASSGTGFGAQGVDFLSGGVLSNQGTILGINTYASGINAGFADDLIINGGPTNGTATIAGWLNGIDQFSGIGTVVNYGTVSSSNGDAVYLQAGGTVGNNGGLISGYRIGINSGNGTAAVNNTGNITGQFGIDISGGTGAVDNSGTIVATRNGGNPSLGVALRNGGSVGNTGLIQATGAIGLYIGGAVGSVTNSGTIVSYYSTGYQYFGAYLKAGGDLTNQATGVIFGVAGGVAVAGGGTVTNYGTISGYQAVAISGPGVVANHGVMAGNAAGVDTVYLAAGGTVTNTGQISGGNDVVKIRIDGLVGNTGTIAAASGTAIWLPDGGTVVNNGLVTGTDDVIFTGYTAGTVINYGTIVDTGLYGDGVCLDAGGFVTNTSTGIIIGTDYGVEVQNAAGTIFNSGTIFAGSQGVRLAAGGYISNFVTGTITGQSGVVDFGAAGTVMNAGWIIGSYGDGIDLFGGGYVYNAASGIIDGPSNGIFANGSAATIINFGTVSGTGGSNCDGLSLNAGGTVTNGGLISGYSVGIFIDGVPGNVDNSSTISATGVTGTGVWLAAGGSVTNAVSGYIQGYDAVVTGSNSGTGVGTVVNSGSIAGGNIGVWLAAGGTVVNAAAITAASGDGVAIGDYGGLGAVVNYGSIVAPVIGVFLRAGGSVGNYGTIASTSSNGFALDVEGGAGTVLNNGIISGYGIGVLLEQGGSVTNFGTVLNPGTYGQGIRIANYGGGTGFVHNYGLISAPTAGISASAPTSLINLGTVAGTGAYGSGDGVALTGYSGTVFNVGTILGTGRGVYLGAGGSVSNQLGASIIGGSGLGIVGGAGTVGNLGTIAGTGPTGVGVFLGLGGSVTNGNASVTTALISGASRGITVYAAPAAVVNYGTVAASIGYAPAVYLVAGGTVNNKSSGLLQGGGFGVVIAGGAGTVTNAGAIAGSSGAGVRLDAGGIIANGPTAAASISGADGVDLLNVGGTIFNGSGVSTAAVIDGSTYGVFARDGASTIGNYGTITGTLGAGVVLNGGGFVSNAYGAVIASGNTGVQMNAAGALSNAGTVQGGNLGVYLAAGGAVVNALAGAIAGGDGIRIIGGAGTITNLGAVSATGTSGFAVAMSAGGQVVNGAATATGASIVGTLRGVSVYGAAGAVTNFGTIAATITYAAAVYLHAGGGLTNQLSGLIRGGADGVDITGAAGTVTNFGSIDGLTDTGVVLAAGGLLVNGSSSATAATISGGYAGVELQNVPATIVNYGTIVDAGVAGVFARDGGSVSNHRLITGYQYGVSVNGGPGTVTNSAEISATGTGGTGVNLLAGGAIANSGTIAGGRNGVFFAAATSIGNQGLITGTGLAGVYGGAGVGIVTNYGTIGGGVYGVRLAGGSTLFNAGTVAGGSLSVYFINGNNRLAIDPGAVFLGNIDAQISTGGDVIELAPGTGVFSGFGSSFVGFEEIDVDPLADWQISGPVTLGPGFIVSDAGALDFDNDLINDGSLNIEAGGLLSFTGTVGGTGVIDFNGAGASLVIGVPSAMNNSIIDFAPTDAIIFVGIGLAASYSYSGGVLRLNNSGGTQIAQASLTTPVTNPHFTLSSDLGGTGTLITVNAQTGTFTGAYFNGVVLSDATAQNPALVTSTAFITNNYGSHSGDAVYGTSAAAWNLTNQGTITTNPTATSAAGVRFQAGGTVSNQAIISGGINGIVIDGGAGAVSNGNLIIATDVGTGAGIALHGGGNVSNATGATIAGFNNGVFINGGIGAIANDGTIQSSATAGGAAVYLGLGGAVTNLAGGLITAYRSAVSINGGYGLISNYGTIVHSSTQSPATFLGAGGVVINGPSGLIFSPHRQAVVISGTTGAVTNSGTILSTATFAQVGTIQTGRYGAVVLNAGGVVSNAPNALIAGHTGVDLNNLFGTVINSGTVSQNDPVQYGAGVLLYGGGLVRNGPNSTALITAYNNAVQVSASTRGLGSGGPGTVVNYGTIAHVGAGTSGSAIYLGSGGIVVNYGLISGSRVGDSASGYPGAVQMRNQSGVVFNFGTIANPNNSNGVNLLQGGILINGAGGFGAALIDAPHTAVYVGAATGTVINYGTIRNTTSLGSAVTMASGGTAVNYGLISSARTGISFTNTAGTIDNFGTVVSTAPLSGTRGSGVYLGGGGVITNEAGGLITAYRAAVSLAALGTTTANFLVTNSGVLSGATGISIGAGALGDNTIVNYGTITSTNGTSGIAILLGGGDDEIVIASTSVLNGVVSNFQPGDTFDLPFLVFSSAETVSLGAGNVLQISQSGALLYSIQLDPSQSFAGNQFGLTNDGAGATLVVLGPDTTSPATQQRVLAVNANSGATPIGILAPSDPDDPPAVLTVTVGSLPSDGTVVLADGVTPVSVGQPLTVAQLTALQFIPTPGLIGQSSTFTYSVSDPAGNTGFGTAFLGINLPPPPNSPSLINGLGGAEGFGENVLPRFDDGSSAAINITSVFGPGGLNFFGHTYTQLFLNNNGNITFNGALSAFTPGPITAGLNNPIIAAFWADVDTRGLPGVPTGGNATGSNLVYYDLDTVNHVFTATWDDVGYYSGHNDKLNAFQLRLIDQGGGNFDIELRYQAVYWTTGDASGGSGGLGGVVARAGYSAGNGVNAYELPQSGDQNAMLGIESNAAPAGTLGTTAETGVYLFQVRNGNVVPPPPTGLALSPASDSAPAGDNSTTDTTPTITGFGISGDTVSVFSDGAAAGSGTVQSNGTWAVTLNPLAAGQHSLTATQADGSGVTSAPSGPLALTIEAVLPPPPPPPSLTTRIADFLFTYNDGKDYYFGTVYDSGNFGYQVGQTILTVAGHYEIFGVETSSIAQASGIVSVSVYSHGGIGQASPTPILTGQGLADGTNGLGSETDSIIGIDGDLHPFSGAVEAAFVTIPLWSFIYTYADGRAFYTGTVASQTPVNSQNVTDAAGNLIGTYSVSQQGLTTRSNGTVVVDRFTLNGLAFTPVRTGASSVSGQGGLGTEQGLITVNGATFGFSSRIEPPVAVAVPTLPLTTPPSPNDVFTATVNSLYRDILGRNPDPAGLATYTNALANGTSVATLRTIFAQSSEAQAALNQLYHQIFGRNIDPGGANTYTDALINGSSLASVQVLLAQSPEAQSAIQRIYLQVLDRSADGNGLTAYMAVLGNPSAPLSLSDVRSSVAHSGEAAADLSQLVVDTLHRPTFAAELFAMENEISTDGVTQQTLQSELVTRNTAGIYTTQFDQAGSNLLSPQPGTPTLFDFTDLSKLASDAIAGFDLIRDTIMLPTSLAPDFANVQSHMQSNATINGTVIHFNSSQEIAVSGIAPGSFTALNFRFV